MKNTVIRYGLIGGILMTVLSFTNWFTIAKSMGYQASQTFGYAGIILSLLTVYFGMKHFRDAINDGQLSFGKGLSVGSLISLVAAALMFLQSLVFFSVWGEEFESWAKDSFKANSSPEEYAAIMKQMEMMGDMSPAFHGVVMALTVFIIGFIIALISAVLLKREAA